MNVVMRINKYLIVVALQTIYDDNSVQAVQVREIFGIGSKLWLLKNYKITTVNTLKKNPFEIIQKGLGIL
jgi:phage gp46-like protein